MQVVLMCFSLERSFFHQEAFAILDHDHDGFIRKKELGRIFRALGHNVTQAEIEKFLKENDQDEDGVLNFDGMPESDRRSHSM